VAPDTSTNFTWVLLRLLFCLGSFFCEDGSNTSGLLVGTQLSSSFNFSLVVLQQIRFNSRRFKFYLLCSLPAAPSFDAAPNLSTTNSGTTPNFGAASNFGAG
jgi:hypothetical protein